MPASFRPNRNRLAYRITRETINQVYQHAMAFPGCTAGEIAYALNVPTRHVHLIIDNVRRCFDLAAEGYVSVINHGRRPAWYYRVPDPRKVPMVTFGPDTQQGTATRDLSVADPEQPDVAEVMAMVEAVLARSTFGRKIRNQYRRKFTKCVGRMASRNQHLQQRLADLSASAETLRAEIDTAMRAAA